MKKRTKQEEEQITHIIGINIEYGIKDKNIKQKALSKVIQMYEGGLDVDIIQEFIEKHYIKRDNNFKFIKN